MKKVEPHDLNVNWSLLDKYPIWSVVSSAELALVLNVHLQTINNWKIRGVLPTPVSHSSLSGNKNYFSVVQIRSWLESNEDHVIVAAWLEKHLPDVETLEQAKQVVKVAWKELGLFRPRAALL
jgi:phage terminase Nu1 subunit (DNA packaging protein)